MIYLTRREHFCSSHRLFNPAYTEAKNVEVYGKCASPNGHGHNYELEVTVAGVPDPETGMILDLKKLGVEVISVSTDTKFTHLGWQREETLLKNVEFIMAGDPTGKVSKLFGVYDENSGLALRGTFIINPDGLLVGSEINYYNVGRDADELLRKMKANVYLAKHPNEACPAKWDTGAKTLKPSAEIVGKIGEALEKS